jgi:SAM-dependent methyltransferase
VRPFSDRNRSRESSQSSVAEFWDHNHHISEDHNFWMAHPICRRAINLRVSGNDQTWPLDSLYVSLSGRRFQRLLSLGCGTGRLERAISRHRIAEQIEGIDGSPVSIDIAKSRSREEQLENIAYETGDLNHLEIRRSWYDAIVFHQSLHHVDAVERLLERVRRALTPDGLLFLEEWVGPSRTEWSASRLAPLRALFEEVPLEWRKWPDLRAPIEEADPTEAVRSSAIRPALRRLFRIVNDKPYGGQIVSVLLPQIERSAIPSSSLDDLLAKWLAIEEEQLLQRPDATYYSAILAVPRRGLGSVPGRVANAARSVLSR